MLGLSNNLSRAGIVTPGIVTDSLVLKHNYAAGGVVPVSDGSAFFDGSNSYIDCGDPIISGTGDYSFCAWINIGTDIGTARHIAGNYGGSNLQGIQFGISGTEKFYNYTDGTNDYVTGATTLSINTWYHVAATRSSNTGIVYVNGVSDATASLDNNIAGDSNFAIGATPVTVGEDFTGYICNVGVWSAVLTQPQIKSIMWKNYADLTSTETTNLVSWWNLDETILGTELITNGTFDNASTAAWELSSVGNNFTISASGNECNVSTTANSDHKYFGTEDDEAAQGYGFSLINGRTYRISFDYKQNSGTSPRLRIMKNHINGTAVQTISAQGGYTNTTVETKTSTFTAGDYSSGTPANIGYLSFDLEASTATNFTIDNVSIKEVLVEDLKGSNDGSLF